MDSLVITTNSELETRRYAAKIAKETVVGDIFLLYGPLGAGKSVFARSLIQSLVGEKIEVPSPTFTLVQTYDTPIAPLWHFDLYRLHDPDDIYELGWEDALSDSIVIVEWPQRLGYLKPVRYKEIRFEPLNGNLRKITYCEKKPTNDN